jgi:histidinol-phosphate phosphatase family protein
LLGSNYLKEIDNSWTLFLDRDGVINKRPVDDYVKSWDEFKFLPRVLEALQSLSKIFNKIIVVTNQQGIGKGIMTVETLEVIHSNMISEIEKHGGRIDAVYYCPSLSTDDRNCRKPNIALAELAKKNFPEIDFEKSVMAGDMTSDMAFGRNAGMKTAYINTNQVQLSTQLADEEFETLYHFSNAISANV